MNPVEGTAIITKQIIDLLSMLSDQQYQKPLETFNGSSIGQHIRHIINFYECMIDGRVDGFIDYDKRVRNPLIETQTGEATATLNNINQSVKQLDIRAQVTVNSSFTDDLSEEANQIESSIGRELMYAYDHAIHHLAMVKIGIKINFPTISISNQLGVAPSTLKYQKASY